MKIYLVTQKIKALGLQAGDLFKEDIFGNFSREYKTGDVITVPEFILRTHPDWFELVDVLYKSKPKNIEKLQLPLDMREYYSWDRMNIEAKLNIIYQAMSDMVDHINKEKKI